MSAEETRELEELLYALTHDVAAPLRVIDGFSEALFEDQQQALPPDALEYLTTIRSATSRMNELFEGILQLHRVTQAPLRLVEIDVTALAETILGELRAADATREVQANVEHGLVLTGDPELIRIAFEQLLRNAWKFTARRTDAVITVGREDARTLFVRDNGVGFDSRSAARMFIPFQRFHASGEFEAGLGIGLALVRRIVHRHGGRVRAAGALQQGATVAMELP